MTSDKEEFQGKKILIVEDNPVNQVVTSKFVEKWGATYDTALNGLECLTKLEINEYDLILMDLEMPELDGFETTREIRKLPYWNKKSIPVVAVTTYRTEAMRKKAFEAGVDEFIEKPIDPAELHRVLSLYLNEAQEPNAQETPKDANIMGFSKYEALADGDRDFLVDLLETNLQYFEEMSTNLIEKVEKEDIEALRFYKHKSKPLFELLNVTRKTEEMEELIQLLARDNPPARLKALAFKKELDELSIEIARYLRELS